jgi:hypothetical protein
MDKNYQQAIRVGVVGGFALAAILVILLIVAIFIINSFWALYYFQTLTIFGTAAVGVLSIRYGKATNNLLITVATTACIAGIISGAIAMIVIEVVNTITTSILFGIQASLPLTIIVDLFTTVIFTLCAALTATVGGVAYSRLYVARLPGLKSPDN